MSDILFDMYDQWFADGWLQSKHCLSMYMLNVVCSFTKSFPLQTNYIWWWNICVILMVLSLLYHFDSTSITSCHAQLWVIIWLKAAQNCTLIMCPLTALKAALQHCIHVEVKQYGNNISCFFYLSIIYTRYPWRALYLFEVYLLTL